MEVYNMLKSEFEKLMNGILKKYGFTKSGRYYFMNGSSLMACIEIQRSSYGNQCYLNLYFGEKEIQNGKEVFPKAGSFRGDRWEDRMETFGRIRCLNKSHGGCRFDCDYINDEQDIEEVDQSIKKALDDIIIPTLNGGIDYIVDNWKKHRDEYYIESRRIEPLIKARHDK